MRLRERVALVTGGSSGIGRAIARDFAAEGARVAIADLQEAPRQGKYHETDVTTSTVDEIRAAGGEARFFRADLAVPAEVEALVAEVVAAYGGLDILVNNAGIHVPGASGS